MTPAVSWAIENFFEKEQAGVEAFKFYRMPAIQKSYIGCQLEEGKPYMVRGGGLPEWQLSECDTSLSTWETLKSRYYARSALKHWRVKVLCDALTAMGRPVDCVPVRCAKNAQHVAGFSPTMNTIWFCGNHKWQSRREFRETLIHELIHAFDFNRAYVDPYNLHHVACAELRAYNLSGQCSYWSTMREKQHLYDTSALDLALKNSVSDKENKFRSGGNGQSIPLITSCADRPGTIRSTFSRLRAKLLTSLPEGLQKRLPNTVTATEPCTVALGTSVSWWQRWRAWVTSIGSEKEEDSWRLCPTPRNRCLSHKVFQSLRDHELFQKDPEACCQAIADVFTRCLRDNWPFMGPPERDGRWRPSRLYADNRFQGKRG